MAGQKLKGFALALSFFVVLVTSVNAIELFHKAPKVGTYSYKTVWYDQKVRPTLQVACQSTLTNNLAVIALIYLTQLCNILQ